MWYLIHLPNKKRFLIKKSKLPEGAVVQKCIEKKCRYLGASGRLNINSISNFQDKSIDDGYGGIYFYQNEQSIVNIAKVFGIDPNEVWNIANDFYIS